MDAVPLFYQLVEFLLCLKFCQAARLSKNAATSDVSGISWNCDVDTLAVLGRQRRLEDIVSEQDGNVI
jgi:hypothetical protein